MRALFFGMGFHQYETEIIAELKTNGYEVDFAYDFDLNVLRVAKIVKSQKNRLLASYHSGLLKKTGIYNYDLVFVIVGRYITADFISKLKKQQKNAEFILYLWDDVARVNNFQEVERYYDDLFCINPYDAKEYNIKLLPLFYLRQFTDCKKKKPTVTKGVFSAMTDYSDRLKLSASFIEANPELNCCLVFDEGNKPALNQRIRYRKNKSIHFVNRGLDRNKMMQSVGAYPMLLDIPFKGQQGLTMRTFESIGAGRKLITTNKEIEKYNFFDKNNIYVITYDNPEVPVDFIMTPYNEYNQEIYDMYSIKTWMKVLLNKEKHDYYSYRDEKN